MSALTVVTTDTHADPVNARSSPNRELSAAEEHPERSGVKQFVVAVPAPEEECVRGRAVNL